MFHTALMWRCFAARAHQTKCVRARGSQSKSQREGDRVSERGNSRGQATAGGPSSERAGKHGVAVTAWGYARNRVKESELRARAREGVGIWRGWGAG